jgi:DNA-binding transcriptional ArsR family regulator
MSGKPGAPELALFHAEVCQALADTTRIALLYELADGPRRVTDLVEALNQPQPTVSRHLKTLRERGMLRAERQGSQVVYSLVDRRVIDALDLLRAVMGQIITNRSRLAQALADEG